MFSLRQLGTCLFPLDLPDGLAPGGNISVLHDLFGYTKAPHALSILTLARGVTTKLVHLNLIRVGSEYFTEDDEAEMDFAVAYVRWLYSQVNLGIGRVSKYSIIAFEADGKVNIDSDAEAQALTEEWSFPDDAVDVFLVRSFPGLELGVSEVSGSCDKQRTGVMTGVVVAMQALLAVPGFYEVKPSMTGQVLAHELGHYLGLHLGLSGAAPGDPMHSGDSENLMFATLPNSGKLTKAQGDRMKKHCSVRTGCG